MFDYETISLNFDRAPRRRTPKKNQKKWLFIADLSAILTKMLMRMTAGREPQVWSSTNAEGHLKWNVYDPFTGQSASELTETQMRSWLENRYNR